MHTVPYHHTTTQGTLTTIHSSNPTHLINVRNSAAPAENMLIKPVTQLLSPRMQCFHARRAVRLASCMPGTHFAHKSRTSSKVGEMIARNQIATTT
jgi:hypothetical protein